MATRKKTISRQRLVGDVLYFIKYHRQQAVNRLFPNSCDDYKQQWLDRDIFSFYAHLDIAHREMLIDMTIETYNT